MEGNSKKVYLERESINVDIYETVCYYKDKKIYGNGY